LILSDSANRRASSSDTIRFPGSSTLLPTIIFNLSVSFLIFK
jgi:hypothetical protein